MAIYRSNLKAPNLQQFFRYSHSRVQGHSFGHDVVSDWSDKDDDDPVFGLYKQCGFWTHDEAAILFHIAGRVTGSWLDIGGATGWTAAHLAQAGANVISVEPMLWLQEWRARFAANVGIELRHGYIMPWAGRSEQFFCVLEGMELRFDGVVIDGDHNAPVPLRDAISAASRLYNPGVILLHDLMGGPVQDAAIWLMDHGFNCRVYYTPHMIACCWRGDRFTPPQHMADTAIDWQEIRTNHMRDFPWERCI